MNFPQLRDCIQYRGPVQKALKGIEIYLFVCAVEYITVISEPTLWTINNKSRIDEKVAVAYNGWGAEAAPNFS